MVEIRQYQPTDETEVINLWKSCDLVVPQNNPQKDIKRKLDTQPELFIVGVDSSRIVASAIFGYDGHRGSVFYLAVAPDFQRRGIGRQMMSDVERRLKDLGCPKLNIMIRTSNSAVIDFYKKLGFSADDVVVMGKRLEKD